MKKKFKNFEYGNLIISLLIVSIILLFISCSSSSDPATPANINLNPTTLDFNTVRTGMSKTMNVTIENTGSTATDVNLSIDGTDKSVFTIVSSNPIRVDGGKTQIIQIKFSPLQEKQYSASIKANDKSVQLTGKGSNSIIINVSDSLNFGSVMINKTQSITIPVENVSSNSLNVNLTISGTDKSTFQIKSSFNLIIAQGKTENITIEFSPTNEKTYIAILNIDTIKSVILKGFGVTKLPINISPQNLVFGKIKVGENSQKSITIQNLSVSPLTLAPFFDATGIPFTIVYKPSKVLNSGDIDSVVIKFAPTQVNNFNSSLYLTSDKSVLVAISGEGIISQDLEINPPGLSYGYVDMGSSKELLIAMKNIFTSTLNLTYSITGADASAFQIVQINSILPNTTSNLKVTFSPSKIGKHNGLLAITTSNNNVYNIPLDGSGQTPSTLTLQAIKAASAPTIDGIEDALWNSATPLNLTLKQVEGSSGDFRTPNATIKAMYDNTFIYFLATIDDNTQNDFPNKFVFNGGDPADDKNWSLQTNGQDGISFLFPITGNVNGKSTTFKESGCFTSCHTAKAITNYESGMYPEQGSIDIWYWKAGTTNPQGYADDYFASGSAEARMGDVIGGPFEDPNFRPSGTGAILPISVSGGNNSSLEKRYIWDETSDQFNAKGNNPITGNIWAKNDYVSGWKLKIPSNDFDEGYRGDVQAIGKYSNGKWTVEFKRKLDTKSGNNDDVVFKPGTDIQFSFAFFDNIRKYASFEYINLANNPKPGHFGSNPGVIVLTYK